jgi:hypothetical protein
MSLIPSLMDSEPSSGCQIGSFKLSRHSSRRLIQLASPFEPQPSLTLLNSLPRKVDVTIQAEASVYGVTRSHSSPIGEPRYEVHARHSAPFGNLWKNPKTDPWERTFALLTGEPNELMLPIHNRLTTVLAPGDYAEYLALSERPPIHLLRILPSNELRATRLEKPAPKLRLKSKADPQISLFGSK